MKKIVVSDTGALISLEVLPDGFKLAQKLYKKIIIPTAVAEEISRYYKSPAHYFKKHDIENFIEVVDSEIDFQISGLKKLDKGEIEAISLAFQLDTPILIEETKGRRVAETARLTVLGIGGVILTAFYSEIIQKAEALKMINELLKHKRINNRIYQFLVENVASSTL